MKLSRSLRAVLYALLLGTTTSTTTNAEASFPSQDVSARSLATRQQAGTVSSKNFLRRAYHASAVVGDWVYIDGGEFSYTVNGGPAVFQYLSSTLSINMSSSWSNSSVVLQSTSKPVGVPSLISSSLWWDVGDEVLYSGFAGQSSAFGDAPPASNLSLWALKPDNQGGGSWSLAIDPGAATWDSLTRPCQATMAFGPVNALVLGGVETSLSAPSTANIDSSAMIPVPGLVTFDMTTKQFTNTSAAGYDFNGTVERGAMLHVPSFGPDSLFVAFGGDISPLTTYTPGSNSQSFANIKVYDPAGQKWYNQTATGNIPEPRIQFCATGVNSTNGTYEIFIYAGWGSNLGAAAIPFDEVYILTLPAFYWTKVQYAPSNPRHGHTCHTVGNRQMLIIGGVDSTQAEPTGSAQNLDQTTFTTPDTFTQGLGIFDLTSLTFSDSYDANAAPYEQSAPIREYYASNPKQPKAWDSPGLETLFKSTHFTQAPPPKTSSTASPSNSASSSSPSPSRSNTGAIAGGVVGGVAGVAIIAGLAAFLLVRRRRRQAQCVNESRPIYNELAQSHPAEMDSQGIPLGNKHYEKPILEMDARGPPVPAKEPRNRSELE
ncbi:MAG: Topoisomerase 1-associated factor 1 [Chaenotheca gracillima]|nr:MAG: Topoisomerase 1-associated factor 1 [Chaenotheca gracillima]